EFQDAISVSRDEKGQVIEIVDRFGDRHAFTYEKPGVIETITDAQGNITVKHRDNSGRLLSEDREGQNVNYSYKLNRQGRVKQTTVTERTAQGITVMQYDKSGRLTSLEVDGMEQTFIYQGQGENEELVTTICNEMGKAREWKYFKARRLVKVKQRDGLETKYGYKTDETGKVLAITVQKTDGDGETTVLKYDGNGKLVSSLNKHAKQDKKMSQEGTLAEQILTFELIQQRCDDQRMDGKRIEENILPRLEK
ncbi:RHS repeat protein, partial [bacterium]|nr:RHS repeat protein [bacterium]